MLIPSSTFIHVNQEHEESGAGLCVPGAGRLEVAMPKAPGTPGGTKHGNKQVIPQPPFYRLPCRDISEQHCDKANTTPRGKLRHEAFHGREMRRAITPESAWASPGGLCVLLGGGMRLHEPCAHTLPVT